MGTALLLPALFGYSAADAQHVDPNKVPQAVKTAFTSKFPKAEAPTWEMEDGKDYEAEFKELGSERSATFDATGKWLETESGIQTVALPASVSRTIAANYADRKITDVERVETSDRGILYEVELAKGKDILEVQLDTNGKVLGSEQETKKEEDND